MPRTPGKLVAGYMENWPHLIHLVNDEGLPVRVFANVNHADDAPVIARAVNCHDKMLELLKELRDSVIDVKPLLLPDVDDIIAEAEGGGDE